MFAVEIWERGDVRSPAEVGLTFLESYYVCHEDAPKQGIEE